jgi:WXXGXW repeat (2 copies)
MTMRDLRFKLHRFLGKQDCDANEALNATPRGMVHRNEEGVRRLWSFRGARLKPPGLFSALVVATTMLASPSQAHIVVVVGVAPPAPIVETVPAPPVAGYVWRSGYWSWNGVRYVWLPGR